MTREADNPMTGCDFDWMVSNHAVWGWKAPVKASVSGVSLLQLSPFFASIFPLFPQKRLILRLPLLYPCYKNLESGFELHVPEIFPYFKRGTTKATKDTAAVTMVINIFIARSTVIRNPKILRPISDSHNAMY